MPTQRAPKLGKACLLLMISADLTANNKSLNKPCSLGHYSMSSTLDTLIRNPVSIGSINSQLYKSHHSKKSHAQKPLTLVNKMQSGKSGSVKRQKHKFKIPTTPEQRSAYWSHRKRSKMIENLPLDFNFFADVNLHRPAVERF